MTAVAAVALGASAAGAALALLRWVRVAQREHYLPGAVTRFARRWWTLDASQSALGAVASAGAVAAIVTPWPALLTALVVGLGPVGLSPKGRTSPLRWTRRCRTFAAIAAVVVITPAAVAGALGGLGPAVVAAALALVAVPLLVDAVLALLAPLEERLARRHVDAARERLRRVAPLVVAITGSYGKTTTKGYLAHLLSGRFSVVASPRSFNNRAGLARTVNELLVPGTDVLVAEMGAYGPGEIAALCAWLPPTVAVITAIGPVHLERFGSLDQTLAAKAEITAAAATVVLNVDDERLAGLARRLADEGRRVLACSAHDPSADVAVVEEDGGLVLVVRRRARRTGRGRRRARAPWPRRTSPVPRERRSRSAARRQRCSTAYRGCRSPRTASSKASPRAGSSSSTTPSTPTRPAPTLALDLLAVTGTAEARRAVVTPGMVELGAVQAEENAAFARHAAAVASDVVVVGRTNRKALLTGLAEAGDGARARRRRRRAARRGGRLGPRAPRGGRRRPLRERPAGPLPLSDNPASPE